MTKTNKYAISAINRPLKILVPMLLSTILIWLIIKFNFCYFDEVLKETDSLWFNDYKSHFQPFIKLFSDLFGQCISYNAPLWSMKELLVGFYLGLVVCLIAGENRKSFLASVAIVLLFIMKEYCLMATMAGIIVAEKADLQEENIGIVNGILVLLMVVYFGGVPTGMSSKYWIYSFLPRDSAFFNTINLYVYIYHIVSAALLLWIALKNDIIKRLLNTRILQFLGRYSMGIYFVHFAILISFTSFVFLNLNIASYNIKVLVTVLLSIVVMIVIAIIFDLVNNKVVKGISSRIFR